MAPNHPGRVGPEGRSTRLLVNLRTSSSSYQDPSQFNIGQTGHFRSPTGLIGQMRGGKGHRRADAGVLQPSLLGSQEERHPAPHNRPLDAQCVSRGPNLQDGDGFFNPFFHQTRRLGGLFRPIGRIFPCSDTPIFEEIPPVLCEQRGFPVSCSALWDRYSSPGIHETYGDCGSLSTSKRIIRDPVFRRLASPSSRPSDFGDTSALVLGSSPESRFTGQSRKIRSDSLTGLCVRRNELSDRSQSSQNSSVSCTEPVRKSTRDASVQTYLSTNIPFPSGYTECSSRFRAAGETACQTTTVLPTVRMVCSSGPFVSTHRHPTFHSPTPSVVAGSGQVAGGSTLTVTSAIGSINHRCQPSGLGSPCGTSGSHDSRDLVTRGVSVPHQQSRDEGCLPSHSSFSGCFTESSCPSVYGQRDSSGLHPKTGGDALSFPISRSQETLVSLQRPGDCALSQTHTRSVERVGGQSVQETPDSSSRVDLESDDSKHCLRFFRQSDGRLVCNKIQSSSTAVCVSDSGSGSLGNRCSVSGLESTSGLRLSSVRALSTSVEENRSISVPNHSDRPSVASESVVQRPPESSVRPPTVSSRKTGSSLSEKQRRKGRDKVSSESKSPPPSRLAIIRRSLRKKRFSERATTLIARARRRSTIRVYDAKWTIFANWCVAREVDPLDPSPRRVADFFTHLFDDKKLSVSTIKGYRSCIANTLSFVRSGAKIGSDPILSELIRSFELSRPVSHSLAPKWDLSCVLWSLTKEPYEPLVAADLKYVTWKTVFLLTLASAKRRSEIHALSIDDSHLRFNADDSVTLTCEAGFLAKTQLPSVATSPFTIPSLSQTCGKDDADRLLCPIRALKFYLQKVKSKRHGRKRLFLPLIGRGNVSAASISRWIASVIRFAYASLSEAQLPMFQIRPHELRALASSWAYTNYIPLDDVLRAAFWRHSSTFSSFYLQSFSAQRENLFMLGPIVAAQQVVSNRSNSSV